MSTEKQTPATEDHQVFQPLDHHIPAPPKDMAAPQSTPLGTPRKNTKKPVITPQDHHIPLGRELGDALGESK
ncbi:hypothetical protein AB0C96_30865 [Streptomyces sp. NPDC048506]|uniref:hypothetical protein n=1 Tax=Streptomyces sp. NPDC048506 TaxID=3155028 RepID=UPI0034160D0E